MSVPRKKQALPVVVEIQEVEEEKVQVNTGFARSVYRLLLKTAKRLGIRETDLIRIFVAQGLGITRDQSNQ